MNPKMIFLFLFLPSLLLSQQEDLTADVTFFEAQAKLYDQWLDKTGLGGLLSVREINVEPNDLSIYLEFSNDNLDYVVSVWGTLKRNFDLQEPITLEQELFYKALHYMQVDPEQLDVQLYDTYDLSEEPLFFRGIYFSEGKVQVAQDNPKAILREVSIPLPRLTVGGNETQVDLKLDMTKEYVFRRILQKARAFYEAEDKKVDGRVPVFKPITQLDQLRFEVANLTREVVTDGNRSYFCNLLRQLDYNCNWSPREVLTYTISYEERDGAISLQISLDGRLGSGVYANARRRSYINLEVEHYPQLEAYAEQMREQIYSWLTRP